MEFRWNNQIQKLQGIDAHHIQPASLKDVSTELRQGKSMFAICLQTKAELLVNRVESEMQQLLKDFKDIFQTPEQLPLIREIDHTITLKKGTGPVNVRPYMYAYFQKAEIKKQVQNMLKLGFIRSSTSPFSSPILLVKKKMAHGVSAPIIKPLML
jgi:hypothetical protein